MTNNHSIIAIIIIAIAGEWLPSPYLDRAVVRSLDISTVSFFPVLLDITYCDDNDDYDDHDDDQNGHHEFGDISFNKGSYS